MKKHTRKFLCFALGIPTATLLGIAVFWFAVGRSDYRGQRELVQSVLGGDEFDYSPLVAVPRVLPLFYVNRPHFPMPAFQIGNEFYFYIRDLAYVLNDTIARFSLSLHSPYAPLRTAMFDGVQHSYRYDPFDPGLWRGSHYTPIGAELQPLPAEAQTARPLTFWLRDMGWLIGGAFGTQAQLDGFAINNRLYVNLRTMGRALGFDVWGGVHTNFIRINTHEPQISEYGRQVAEEFLEQFLSLRYRVRWIYAENRFALECRETGAEIEIASGSFYYCAESRSFVHSARMYDLNGDGIPEIVVQWGPDESRWNNQTLYVYMNGGFEAAADIWLHIFYRCVQGKVFLYSGDLAGYTGQIGRFYSVVMDGSGLHLELLFSEYLCWQEGDMMAHSSGALVDVLGEDGIRGYLSQFPMATHPLRTGEPLFPIRPFGMGDITAP